MKKPIITFVLTLLVFFGTTAFIVNYSSGIAGCTGSPGEGDCSSCHGGGSSISSSITISSVPAFSVNQFVPGTTYTITVNVAATGFNKFGFDCEILDSLNASIGTMQTSGTGVYFLQAAGARKNAVHNAPRSGPGSANFNFKWVAPTVGDTATIYASGNAVNGNGTTTGDFPLTPVFLQLHAQPQQPDTTVNVGIYEIKKSTISSVCVYPNPASNLTTISYTLEKTLQVTIQLADLNGRSVKQFIKETESDGAHSHLLDLHGIAPGIYFVKLSSEGLKVSQKMISIL